MNDVKYDENNMMTLAILMVPYSLIDGLDENSTGMLNII